MSRIRFLTAMAVGAVATEPIYDAIAADGVSPAYLAYEWLVAEAIARDAALPRAATLGVAGIDKARSVVVRRAHMDSRSYLKTPKVFGFHGIYKRLARALDVIDANMLLGPAGDRLLRAWEEEQELPGFVDRVGGTTGGRLAATIEKAVSDALSNAHLTVSFSSHLWSKLVRPLRLDGALPQERELLMELLVDPDEPIRRELILRIRDLDGVVAEFEVVRALADAASHPLSARLVAIDAYERVAEMLTAGLTTLQRVSTGHGTSPIAFDAVESHPILVEAARELPAAVREVEHRLGELGEVVLQATMALAAFESVTGPPDLAEALLDRHEQVQEAKGKRPWFERTPRGFVVRPLYRTGADSEIVGAYVHPYRILAVRSFLDDLAA
jgi:hypothetical protein